MLEVTCLPVHFVSWHHHVTLASERHEMPPYETATYYLSLDHVEIAFYFGRIAFFALLALIFWNCSPRIACFLLPPARDPSPSHSTGA
jgi:hypothetical protein